MTSIDIARLIARVKGVYEAALFLKLQGYPVTMAVNALVRG